MTSLQSILWDGLSAELPDITRNGNPEHSLPNIVSISFPRVTAQNLMTFLESERVILSAGSACHSHSAKQSRVLDAVGIPLSSATLRFSVSHLTTQDECYKAVERTIKVLRKLRP
jgi:cysteine desulfurase